MKEAMRDQLKLVHSFSGGSSKVLVNYLAGLGLPSLCLPLPLSLSQVEPNEAAKMHTPRTSPASPWRICLTSVKENHHTSHTYTIWYVGELGNLGYPRALRLQQQQRVTVHTR